MQRTSLLLVLWIGLSSVSLLSACGDEDDGSSANHNNADNNSADNNAGEPNNSADNNAGEPNNSADNNAGEPNNSADNNSAGTEGLPPTDGTLLSWLEAGNYTEWAAESGPHNSTGPHFGLVKTFVNPTLEASLAVSNETHPIHSAIVKELYGEGTEVLGYSVMVKLDEDSNGGQGWYWFEGYEGRTFADATGASLCTGCHAGGTDYVLTPYPLQ